MSLSEIDDPAWARLLAVESRLRALGDPDETFIPAAKLNRILDRKFEAADAVYAVPGLLDQVRALAETHQVEDPADRRFLWELLMPPLELWPDIEKLLGDARVGLTPKQVRVEPALYLAEDLSPYGRRDPYESEVDDPDMRRDLNRIGGVPTIVPELEVPNAPFLVQVDFAGYVVHEEPDVRGLGEIHAGMGLPVEGVLQLFHTTAGDSHTDPQLPGGGATLRYLSEDQLTRRVRIDTEDAERLECSVFPVQDAVPQLLPSVTFGQTLQESEAFDEDATLRVERLQKRIDLCARGNGLPPEAARLLKEDPFLLPALPVIRVLGVQHYDHELAEEDIELLGMQLPLRNDGDEHVMIFGVPSEGSFDGYFFDGIFGDSGWLEVWMRRSDLTAKRFDQVVSFWRST